MKIHDLKEDEWKEIEYEAQLAYQRGWPENPYPRHSDAWEAWEHGIDRVRPLDD